MKKITDGIYTFTLKLPFPATPELSLYYLDDDVPALIDTGLGDNDSMARIASELGEIHRAAHDLRLIINTHEHIEHFGGNRKVKEASGAIAAASEAAAPYIEHFQEFILKLRERYVESNSFDMLRPILDFNLSIDESVIEKKVRDGDSINLGSRSLRVIETPGHAHGHICLYDAGKKILFTGDHIISTGSTFVGYGWRELAQRNIVDIFMPGGDTPDNLTLYLDSLKKLQSLDIGLILPAHGIPITDPGSKIEEEIRRKLDREKKFLEVLDRRKELALDDLIREAYEMEEVSFLLRGAALGYLERLYAGGKIEAMVRGEVLYLKIRKN